MAALANGDEALEVAVFAAKIATVSVSQFIGVARELGCHVTSSSHLFLLDVIRRQEISPSTALKAMGDHSTFETGSVFWHDRFSCDELSRDNRFGAGGRVGAESPLRTSFDRTS